VRRANISALVGGSLFLVLAVKLGYDCFQALAYREHLRMGLEALDMNKLDQARVEFTLSSNANPQAAEPYFYRALVEARQGNHRSARSDYIKLFDLDEKAPETSVARGWLCIKTQRYKVALDEANRAIDLDPLYWDAYSVRASANIHLGKLSEAIADCTTWLNHNPKTNNRRATVLAKRGYAWDCKQEYEAALKDYSEAIACDHYNGFLYGCRAIVQLQTKNWQAGLADATRGMELQPGIPAMYKVRGLCYAGTKLGQEALDDLDQLVGMLPNVETHRIRGNERYVERDFLGTLEDFDYVLAAEPDDRDTNFKYQKAKFALQATAKRTSVVADEVHRAAIPTLDQLKGLQTTLVRKGYDLMMSGDNEPAIVYLTAAVKANPNDPYARRYLAYTYEQHGMDAEAVTQFEILAKLQAFQSADHLMYAKALTPKQPERAVAVYNSLLVQEPTNVEARTNLIKTLISHGSPDKAVELAHEGIKQMPGLEAHYNNLLRAIASNSKEQQHLM
jgi:tetratricopeptide (TPR) repeat protein